METTQERRKKPKAEGADPARQKKVRQEAAPSSGAQQKKTAEKTATRKPGEAVAKPRREAPAVVAQKKKAPMEMPLNNTTKKK